VLLELRDHLQSYKIKTTTQRSDTLPNSWRRNNPQPEPDLSPVERARVKEMEDELRRLRMENEFLKKAAAFFARTQP
jgi:transposase-like protein